VLSLRRKHPFVYPIRPAAPNRPPPRTAVFLPCFLSRAPVRVFRKAWSDTPGGESGRRESGRSESGRGERGRSESGRGESGRSDSGGREERWSKELQRFEPEAIAATLEQFKRLAHAKIPRPRNAVIVLHRSARPGDDGQTKGDARLTEADRDWLWDTFRVPIFEQIIGENGELLATECEAHNGMHIESARLPGDPRDLDITPCPCGRDTPRLFPPRPASPPESPQRSAAAHA
jgi:hypothetical protein